MKAVILAAGMGRRLQEASGGMPKSMINIGNKTLIHRQINSCLDAGVTEFVIVLGFKKGHLRSHILEILNEEQVVFVENPIYGSTNTLYSLWLTRDYLNDDFIYFNADVIFKSDLVKKITSESSHSQLLLETKSCGEEEVKMVVDKDNRIHKIGKKLAVSECAGEFIGVGKFAKEVLSDFIEELSIGVNSGQENNFFEFAVDKILGRHSLYAVSTDGLPCVEIDFPEDLERALELFDNE